jgi:histidinol-phosphate phosphatase family protein
MKWAVFLDRDGVLTEEREPVLDADKLHVFSQAPAAVKRLRDAGALAILVTNQPLVGRGKLKPETLKLIHEKLEKAVGGLDGIYFCPHAPEKEEGCPCRKPKTGMFEEAAQRFGLEPENTFMVGDSTRDILAGQRFGCKAALLVLTGNAGEDGRYVAKPDATVDDVAAAADWILENRPS